MPLTRATRRSLAPLFGTLLTTATAVAATSTTAPPAATAPASAATATDAPPPAAPAPPTTVAPAPSPAPAASPTTGTSGARPASHGFQMYLRTGAAFPVGDATGNRGDQLGRRYAWQVPFAIGLGGKITEAIYVGGYFGLAFGAEGSDLTTESACRDRDDNFQNDIACSALSLQLGLEGIYYFRPAERWSPWLGYGFGIEASQETIEDRVRKYREEQFSSGYTVAKLSVGVDRRSAVGIGPFGEIAVGRFTHVRTDVNDAEVASGSISSQAFHAWITLGLRLVVAP